MMNRTLKKLRLLGLVMLFALVFSCSIRSGQTVTPSSLQGAELQQYLKEIVSFSQQSKRDGNILWGRVAGTSYDKQAAEYVKKKFQEFGLEDVRSETIPLEKTQWWPTKLNLTLIGGSSSAAPKQDFNFVTAFAANPSVLTPPEGIEAPVVDIGRGTPADIQGRDLTDKIALLHSDVRYNIFNNSAQQIVPRLAKEGKALGVIVALHPPGNTNMKVATNVGGAGRSITWLTIGDRDGDYLEKVVADSSPNAPRVRMTVRGEGKTGWTTQNTLGLLRGTTDEYIVILAHVDGWFEGAVDNGSGVSTLLGLARYYSQVPQAQRRRNLLFVATGGHHTGPAIGTKTFVKQHQDILPKTALLVNLEHVASSPPTNLGTNQQDQLRLYVTNLNRNLIEFFQTAAKRYNVQISGSPVPKYEADLFPFARTNVPGVMLIENFFWYHTDQDTVDKVPVQGLERVARSYAYVIDQANTLSLEQLQEGSVNRGDRQRRRGRRGGRRFLLEDQSNEEELE